MAYYAFLDSNNIVTEVITGKDETDTSYDWEQWYSNFRGLPCKRTSYNTWANTHRLGGTPYRKNFGQIGFTYDATRDAFIPPKPYESWLLDENTCTWQAPTPRPNPEFAYTWNESTKCWDLTHEFDAATQNWIRIIPL
jgi:hypothetical protein